MSEFGAPGDSSVLISVDVVNFSGNSLGLRADSSLTSDLESISIKPLIKRLILYLISTICHCTGSRLNFCHTKVHTPLLALHTRGKASKANLLQMHGKYDKMEQVAVTKCAASNYR